MSFYKEVPGLETTLESTLKFDIEPKADSTNPVTSDGVKSAIDGAVGYAAENLQEQIDEIAEKAGSGYTPKGEATVATLNGLSGHENGWLYTLTDAGTLTDGTLAVVAGDTVAWDATNGVWYRAMDYAPAQYGTNEVHNLPTTITAFRTGDVIPVDGPSGTAKMAKDNLLKETTKNAQSEMKYMTDADENAAKIKGDKETAVSGYIVTNTLDVGDTIDLTDITSSSSVSHVIVDALMGDQFCYDGKSGAAFQAIIAVNQNSKIIDKISYVNGKSIVYTAPIYTRKILFQGFNVDTPNFGVWRRKSIADAIDKVVVDYTDKVNKINEDIQEWRVIPAVRGRYLVTNVAVGEMVEFICTSSANTTETAVAVIPVKAGDKIKVLGNCGTGPRLWAFLDTNQKLISKAPSGTLYSTPRILEATADGYFVGNSWTNVSFEFSILSYKDFKRENDFPQAKFNIGHDFISSVGSFFDEFSFTAQGRPLIFGQVQGKYDNLITDYPEQVSKVNAYTTYGVEKPAYNTEETYLYHFDFKNPLLTRNNVKRKKVLIVGGTHGNEYAGQLSPAFFMDQMCRSNDPFYAKFRQCCDIYVIPVLCEYGSKNQKYTNGNGVNINRNYPIYRWMKSGEDTLQFTGDTPGSEGETKLVMAVVAAINPDIIVDCHSFDYLGGQFYCVSCQDKHLLPSYDWAMDCGIACVKNLPEYFGNIARIFVDWSSPGALPAGVQTPSIGTLDDWGAQVVNGKGKGVITLEVSTLLNYLNGVPTDTYKTTQYTSNVWKVNEYAYRRIFAGLLETCLE